MKRLSISLLFLFTFSAFASSFAQTKSVNYLGISGPLSFQNNQFSLAWSSHPNANYYKHEYLQKGDSLANFKTMLLLEVLSGSAKLTEVVEAKVNELRALKTANPIVQYEVFSNAKNGEYLIDFLLTANAADGSAAIAERNVYRYKTITDKNGQPAILLFGASTRKYGKDITAFLTGLKSSKKTLINEVVQFRIPPIRL